MFSCAAMWKDGIKYWERKQTKKHVVKCGNERTGWTSDCLFMVNHVVSVFYLRSTSCFCRFQLDGRKCFLSYFAGDFIGDSMDSLSESD